MNAVAELPQQSAERNICVPQDADALVERLFDTPEWKELEEIEGFLGDFPPVDMPLKHIFTPGLYVRQIYMKAGTIATTRIHLTEHPFNISCGSVSVWSKEHGWVLMKAPYLGVTKAGTRRMLYAHEDTIWSTFHVTNKTDPDEILKDITYMGGKYADLGIASESNNKKLCQPHS